MQKIYTQLCCALCCLLFSMNVMTAQTTTCTAPTLSSLVIDSTSLKLGWLATIDATYELQYTASPSVATSIWTTVPVSTNPTNINNLSKCKEYVLRLRMKCTNGVFSDWIYKTAKTSGCVKVLPCALPVCSSSVDSTSITIAWNAIVGSTYEVQYTVSPATTTSLWSNVATSSNPANISGLSKCKEYTFRIRAKCSSGLLSNWVYKTTKTTGCKIVVSCPTPYFIDMIPDTNRIALTWPSSMPNVEVQYTAAPISSTSIWSNIVVTGNPLIVTGLSKCKEYSFRIRAKCINGVYSSWTIKNAKTTGCAVVPQCYVPYFSNIIPDTTNVKVTWGTVLAGTAIEMQYTLTPMLATSVWTSVNVTSSPMTISGLSKCKEYAIRIRSKCANNTFSSWITQTTKTTGCQGIYTCLAPFFTNTLIDSTSGKVGWSVNNTGAIVEMQYTSAPSSATSAWTSVASVANPMTINGLSKCKEYEIRIRVKCTNNNLSPWVSKIVKTTGCGSTPFPCTSPVALTAVPDSTSMILGWVANAGITYELAYALAPANLTTSVWTPISTTNGNPYKLLGLKKCTEYTFRFRAKCTNGVFGNWLLKTVKTKGCATLTCARPTNLKAVPDSNSVVLSWLGASDATYFVECTVSPVTSTSIWKTLGGISNPMTVKSLAKCKAYVFRVRTICSPNSLSDWTLITTKTTGCVALTPCPTPYLLESTPIVGGVALSWVGTGVEYEVRYSKKTAGTVLWTNMAGISTSSYTITNLEACVFYAWQVRTKCQAGNWSDWSASYVFETGGCNNRIAKILSVYPNPGAYLNVDYTISEAGDVAMSLTNLQGKIVANYPLGKKEIGTHLVNFDNLTMPAGVYVLAISINGVKKEVQRWVKTTD